MTKEKIIECLNYQNEKFFGGQSEALKMSISYIKRFDGMTNGEVIQTLFPNETMFEQTETCTYYGNMRFDTKWWNASYNTENEDKE